jgi:GT2 family glycosyltransferase
MRHIVAVVVTVARPRKLEALLRALDRQRPQPDATIVVENTQDCETAEVLRRHPEVRHLASRRNLGGAGGFAYGILGALTDGATHAWLTAQLERVSGRSTLAEAIRYALRHWPGLVLFLEDGRIELDNNTVERALRPIALGRKNALFAGSDGGARHWAIVASLVATAKLNGVEPQA